MHGIINKKLLRLFNAVRAMLLRRGSIYRIVDIDVAAQEVLLRIRNKAIILKLKFSEVINDSLLIQGLSPIDACWIGGHFGRAMRLSLEKGPALKKAKSMTIFLENNYGLYRIVFLNRSGEVCYINQKTKEEYIEHPITIAQNVYIISKFDSSQACYIGILAGISMEKTISKRKKTGKDELNSIYNKMPKLRVVK